MNCIYIIVSTELKRHPSEHDIDQIIENDKKFSDIFYIFANITFR